MQRIAGVTRVVFDPLERRFEGQVSLPGRNGPRVLTVSAPGHACWGHRQIRSALIASAQVKIKETRHAGA